MTSTIQKRKHKTLTIKEKSDILDRLDRNESFSKLASEYGVGRSTIYDIKKNRKNIQKFMFTTDCGPGKRQTLKKAVHPEVEEALYLWFLQERNRNKPISGAILAMKAKFFYKRMIKKDDFVPNKGWLERFKNRYGIRLMTGSKYASCKQIATEAQISSEDLENWYRGINEEKNAFQHLSDDEIINLVSTPIITEDECEVIVSTPIINVDDDNEVIVSTPITKEDYNDEVIESTPITNEDNDDKVIESSPQVTAKNAVDAFEVGIKWAEENGVSHNEILLLRRLKDKASLMCLNNEKQKIIDDFHITNI